MTTTSASQGVERGEATDGDAVEQARVVPLDEEDYR
jgi:hypothetical protein